MKSVAFLFFLVIFIFISPDVSAYKWEYNKFQTRSTPTLKGSTSYKVLYNEDSNPFETRISCFDGIDGIDYGIDKKGKLNFLINLISYNSTYLRFLDMRLKFDSNASKEIAAVYYLGSLGIYENFEEKDIINKMKKHTTMTVEFDAYQNRRYERYTATIDLRGFTKEYNKLPSYCRY